MNKTNIIPSLLSQETVGNNLRTQTIIQQKYKYCRWMSNESKMTFYGVVKEHGFKISPCIQGRNFFTPVIIGEIMPSKSGCLLKYTVTLSPDMKKVYFFSCIVAVLYFITLVTILCDPSALYGSKLLFFLFPVGIGILITAFSILNFSCLKKFKKTIRTNLCKVAER